MNAYRIKFLLCALLVFSSSVAGAQRIQRIRRPALGNEILAKQHSAKFLAERGIPARFSGGGSPAQLLARSRARYRQQVQQLVASGVNVPAWQPLGPDDVITTAYGAVTGRVTSIAADPSDPTGNTIYVGTASGGVWKSTNAAGDPASVTLVPLTDYVYSSLSEPIEVPSLSIGAVSVQPVAPGATPVLLAGTGEPNDTTASYLGSGILRSTDGGNQWTLIANSSDLSAGANTNYVFTGNGFAGFAWGTVGGNPVVVAAVSRAEQGIEVTPPGGQQDILGIYYSIDLGKTWFMATITDQGGAIVQSPETAFVPCEGSDSRQPCGNAVTSIVWNPVRKVFLAAVRFHGYYQSTDGQNWTRLASQPGANLTPAMCPSQPGYSGSQACPIYNGALAVQPVTGDTFALTTDINNLDQGLWQDACNLSSGACASSTLAFTQIDDTALEAGTLNPSQPSLIPQADYDFISRLFRRSRVASRTPCFLPGPPTSTAAILARAAPGATPPTRSPRIAIRRMWPPRNMPWTRLSEPAGCSISAMMEGFGAQLMLSISRETNVQPTTLRTSRILTLDSPVPFPMCRTSRPIQRTLRS